MRLPPPPRDVPFAHPARVLLPFFDAFRPPRPISVAAHASRHRWVSEAGSGALRLWDHDVAPYLREPMEALTDPGIDTVALVGPGACGKTMVAENWLLHGIHADPADLLWYLPTEPLADAYVKARIEPMLEAHERLIGHLRHGRDSTSFKRFRGGRAEFLAFTASNLTNKHVPRIVCDEYDGIDPRQFGDPEDMLNPRRQSAMERGAHSCLVLISHPDLGRPLSVPIEQQRGIMRVYLRSDRRTFWWQCPHCGGFSSPAPGTPKHMALDWPADATPEQAEEKARLACPHNGCLITDTERRQMLRGPTRWLCEGQSIDADGHVTGARRPNRTAGFWITGTMSPFTKGGIGGIAKAIVRAEREMAATGDWKSLHQVMVKTAGLPYAPPARLGSVDAQALAERAEDDLKPGIVPDGVRFLTAWADAQGDRWELLVRGWGEGGESWPVLHQVIPGDPAGNATEWDALLERLATLALPLADGSGRVMRLRAAGFDAFGQPGVTEQAQSAWLRRRQRGLVRKLGVVEGREAWDLVATRGASSRNAPRLMLIYPNTQRKDRRTAWRGNVPLLLFNPNLAKDALSAALAVAPPAGGCVHIPRWLLAEKPPHPFLEGLAAEQRDPATGRWTPVPGKPRNEPLDMMVGCELIARLHGLHRINWERPPAWAAPWETNSMIVAKQDVIAAAVVRDPAAPQLAAKAPPREMPPPVVAAAAARGLAAMLAS